MEPSKWRIAKACQECRIHKTRCSGLEPCQRCVTRGVPCVYRTKARTRMKKSLGATAAAAAAAAAAGTASTTAGTPDDPATQTATPGSGGNGGNGGNGVNGDTFLLADGDTPTSTSSLGGRPGAAANAFNNHSVAATHRASPSVFLQLYYGPSSNFSLLNSIYQKMEMRRDQERQRRGGGAGEGSHPDGAEDPDATRGVEEIGPGLDLFNNRRLYFGDLAGGSGGAGGAGGASGGEGGPLSDGGAALLFIDRALAKRLLEHYLDTYWLLVPIWTRRTFRARLGRLYGAGDWRPAGPEDPDTVIVLLALALGTSVLGEERTAQYLFGRAKAWAAALDGIVNVQTVQIALLMSIFETERARPNSSFLMAGVAVRRAVAAGMHKGVVGRWRRPADRTDRTDRADRADRSDRADNADRADDPDDPDNDDDDDTRQGRITIWGLYFWETWLCFSLGRPSAFPQAEMDVPFPAGGAAADMGLLQAAVKLARIMAQCAARIYHEHHDSLLPMWNAANDIRRDLRAFAEQQSQAMGFGVLTDAQMSELGMSQTMLSAIYHHTLLLTFRPFLVLRAKLRQTTDAAMPTPPAWLDTACEYCLDAARHSIAFLARAFELSELCRAVRYTGFFLEGASHVMAFELLQQDQDAGRCNLPWLRLAIRALNILASSVTAGRRRAMPVDLASNIEQMVRFVYPDFRADQVETSGSSTPGAMTPGRAPATDLHDPHDPQAPAATAGLVPAPAPAAAPAAAAAAALPPRQRLQPPPIALPHPPPVLRPSAPATTLPGQGRGLLNAAATTTSSGGGGGGYPSSIVPPLLFPYTTFSGLDSGGASSTQSPTAAGSAGAGLNADAPGDLSLADLGWNFDFATMDLESFLSIDPSLSLSGPHTFW